MSELALTLPFSRPTTISAEIRVSPSGSLQWYVMIENEAWCASEGTHRTLDEAIDYIRTRWRIEPRVRRTKQQPSAAERRAAKAVAK